MSAHSSWLRSAKLISVCTLASRALGLVRDMMMAALFGTGAAMDAFVLAFMVPNLFRRLFGEGAMSAAFVPVLTGYEHAGGEAEARRFFSAVFSVLLALLGLATVVVWLACVLAPRWLALDATWRLFFPLLQIVFPYMPLICLTALMGAALNVRRHFLAPALAPVLLNVCWIAGLALGAREHGVVAVAVAVLVGGMLQLGLAVAALRRYGLRPGLRWEPRHEGVRRVGRLMAPVMVGLAVMQLNVVVDGLIAKLCVPGAGANSALYYGNRLMQFPLGVFGAALATAIYPTLASQAKAGDHGGLLASVRHALRLILFIALPVTAIAAVLRDPIVAVVFRRGDFGAESAARTGAVLMFYCLGLPAYFANQVMRRGFFALEDTRTPVRVGLGVVALNLCLNLILVWPMREAGLALATAACTFINVAVLLALLRRRLGHWAGRAVLTSGAKSLAAAVACAGVAWAMDRWLSGVDGPPAWSESAWTGARLLGAMLGGGVAFVTVASLLGMPEVSEVLGIVTRRRRGKTRS